MTEEQSLLKTQGLYVVKSIVSEIIYDFVNTKSLKFKINPSDIVGSVIYQNIYSMIQEKLLKIFTTLGFEAILENVYISDFIMYSVYQVVFQMIIRTTDIKQKQSKSESIIPIKKEALKFDKIAIRSAVFITSEYIVSKIMEMINEKTPETT